MTRGLRLLALLLLVPLATGCPTTRYARNPTLHTLTRQELIALVNHNGQVTRSMSDTSASITMREPGQNDSRRAKSYIAFARGGRLRINILVPFRGSVMEICSNGRTIWIDDKTNNTIYRDRVNALNRITRSARQLLPRPEDLISALALEPVEPGDPNVTITFEEGVDLISTNIPKPAEEEEPETAEEKPEAEEDRPKAPSEEPKKDEPAPRNWRPVYFLFVGEKEFGQDYLIRKFVIDRTSLQLVRQLVYDRAERVVMDVRYADFRPVDKGNLILAHTIAIEWPLLDSSLTLSFAKIQINSPLNPDRFNYPKDAGLDPGTEFRPLSP